VRQAENAFRQQLSLLRQEGANLGMQVKDVEANLKTTEARLAMAKSKIALTSVSMPVAGHVAEMKVTGTGELVAAGALVAVIVPDGVPLVVQAASRTATWDSSDRASKRGSRSTPIRSAVRHAAGPRAHRGARLGNDNSFTVTLDLLATRISDDERAFRSSGPRSGGRAADRAAAPHFTPVCARRPRRRSE